MTVAATELFAPQFFFRKLLFISITVLNVSIKYIVLSGCNAPLCLQTTGVHHIIVISLSYIGCYPYLDHNGNS